MFSVQVTILLCINGFIMMSPLFKAILKKKWEMNSKCNVFYFVNGQNVCLFWTPDKKRQTPKACLRRKARWEKRKRQTKINMAR